MEKKLQRGFLKIKLESDLIYFLMSFHHQLLIITRPIQKVVRQIGCKLGFISPNRLRVLLYHDIPLDRRGKTL